MIAKSSVFLILLVTCTLCALGYQPPSKTPLPSFLPSSPLKSGNFPSLPFLANLPLYISFSWTPLKVGSFSETQKYFSLLIPSYLLKVTKFLDKISQFEFLAMREKNIFACKLFLSLNISDFNLFMWKFHPPPPPYPVKKVTSLLHDSLSLKVEVLSNPSLLENLVGGSIPPLQKGGCTLWCMKFLILLRSSEENINWND